MLGAAGGHPAMKKAKYITDLPPVQNGVLSASKTPTIDEGRFVNIKTAVVTDSAEESLRLFFDEQDDDGKVLKGREDIPDYPIANSVGKILERDDALEEELRDAVFTDLLDNHKVQFPKSSWSGEEDKNGNKKYRESFLNNLLAELGKETNQGGKTMQRIMRGLPVTTTGTSKPDLTPMDTQNGEWQIRMGEFKNADKYKEEDARTQCLMYLLALLYWLRTVVGKPVESVYGFYVCGSRCSDQEDCYTVGLLQLSAPMYLGDTVEATCLTETAKLSDSFPLRLLIHFLKKGRRWRVSDHLDVAAHPIPCLFVLPTTLWVDDQERELVVHGTLSIVFRISARGFKSLLQCSQSPHFREFSHNTTWREFCGPLGERGQSSEKYYLKIRSLNASWQRKPMGAMINVWDLLTRDSDPHNFLKTYLRRPFVDEKFGLVLMKDRGSRLNQISGFEMSVLKEFLKVTKTAMFLSDHLPHGDVLPHNLVFDEENKEMTLIDIDEGVGKPHLRFADDHIPKRKNEYHNDDRDWYIALSYPNPLRTRAIPYTQSQLIASFLYLMSQIKDLSDQIMKDFDPLGYKVTELGKKLCIQDKKDSAVNKLNRVELENMVQDAYGNMMKIVMDYSTSSSVE